MEAALDLLRRLPPSAAAANLAALRELLPPGAGDALLGASDQPLAVKFDEAAHREFVACEYNRDGDSHRCEAGRPIPAHTVCVRSERTLRMLWRVKSLRRTDSWRRGVEDAEQERKRSLLLSCSAQTGLASSCRGVHGLVTAGSSITLIRATE